MEIIFSEIRMKLEIIKSSLVVARFTDELTNWSTFRLSINTSTFINFFSYNLSSAKVYFDADDHLWINKSEIVEALALTKLIDELINW